MQPLLCRVPRSNQAARLHLCHGNDDDDDGEDSDGEDSTFDMEGQREAMVVVMGF